MYHVASDTIVSIRKRLLDRRAPIPARCQSCGHEQFVASGVTTMPSSLAVGGWICEKCGGQTSVTFTLNSDLPSPDEDIATLLELLT
jgi:ribosomal protein S27E